MIGVRQSNFSVSQYTSTLHRSVSSLTNLFVCVFCLFFFWGGTLFAFNWHFFYIQTFYPKVARGGGWIIFEGGLKNDFINNASISVKMLEFWSEPGELKIDALRVFDSILSSPHQLFIDCLLGHYLGNKSSPLKWVSRQFWFWGHLHL